MTGNDVEGCCCNLISRTVSPFGEVARETTKNFSENIVFKGQIFQPGFTISQAG
jgi:hypothetical protein